MLPTVLLTAEEAIKRVPPKMREAAIGMGATPTQVVLRVVLPTALPGVLTGVMLAVARAAGETAPLLFTALFSDYWISRSAPEFLPKTLGDLMKPTASLAVLIYDFSGSPFDNQIDLAWAAALVLVAIVLIVNVAGRALARRVRLNRGDLMATAATNGNGSAPTNGNGATPPDLLIDCKITELFYGKFKAVRDVDVQIQRGTITAFIGPSGCGKSTALRCLNRMNDLVRGFRFKGHVNFRGQDIYAPTVDPVSVRRHIGMVFQQPNPFAMSIYRNVAFGLRLNGIAATWPRRSSRRCATPRCGTRSRTSCTRAACRCPAASSSGCASRARSPPSRRCC